MKAHLIDGSGYIYRAFYTLPAMTKSDGTPVGAIYGYCEMMQQLLERMDGTHIAVILDGGRSGRDQVDAAYKANRKPRPQELIDQLGMLAEATTAHSIPSVKMPGMEADDVIATYAKRLSENGDEVVVYSSDKDLLPLLCLEGVTIFDPLKKQWVTPEICFERHGVTPEQITDFLAIVGDESDNIPGVPKVGKKGAAQLLQVHSNLETILMIAQQTPALLECTPAQRTSLRDNHDLARKSLELARLRDVDDLPALDAWDGVDAASLHAWLSNMEFALLARKVEQQFGVAA